MDNLLKQIKALPDIPGVYQYFDKNNKLLYIGKAKSLKKRVKSYWRFTPHFRPNPDLNVRILKMLNETTSIQSIVVESEEDALILENSLIKQLKPKYNILLRDDKTYPYIYIDESKPFARFEITRKAIKGKKISYYGPFPNGARELIDTIYELYPLVQKRGSLKNKKLCLFYQIGKCLGPCEGKVTQSYYNTLISQAKEGILNRELFISKLQQKMLKLASQERFEEAATIRDKIKAIESLQIKSGIDLANGAEYDIFAIDTNGNNMGVVVRIFLRDGKIASSNHSFFRIAQHYDISSIYRQSLLDFYKEDSIHIVKEILISDEIEDIQSLQSTISKRLNKKVSISIPKRGNRYKMIELAKKNASELLRQKEQNRPKVEIQKDIAKLFELDTIPWRVEVFDNSHHMGEAPVGAMVVYDENSWDKSSYRRYQLTSSDEYHQMMEMLQRRISDFDKEPPPDMWLLDGGTTLLKLAHSLLLQVGVDIKLLAIAKEKIDAKAHRAKGSAKDIIYSLDKEYRLMPSDKRLQWLQRLRDEAHRFAITYHRNKKQKDNLQSQLLNKKGIGPATIKKLLSYFGSFEAINQASFEDIAKVTNKKVANIIANSK